MKLLERLSPVERGALLKFPAYISLLAAQKEGRLDDVEKKSAIGLSHIRTYAGDPLLTDFFKEAERVFVKNIEQLDQDLPKERHEREDAIKNELTNLEKIVVKLGKEYASTMFHSMKLFKDHVSQAHHNVLVDFIFPMPIKGLTY
ncbi:hypothetical protein OCK74_22265 [Chitinophagaceae bacterium LB-8]|uniref:Uncharacterized protein n=1 Tax=Paraflavisolibacter caeni TaxID=2982496 RepID=A0A9X2XYS4_9BACT|nr:hypothetical protein [Paraflavisolibacter caeni]MCU7551861.1 hypothetical protein [Paraflavisolibacter caeni]